MLKFNMVDKKEGKVLYEYFPEGGTESGVVSFDEKSGDVSIESLAKNDRHERYAVKMFKRIREMASKGTFDKEGIVAWY